MVDIVSVIALLILGSTITLLYKYAKIGLAEVHNKTVLKNIRERDYIREDILENTAATRVSFFRTHNKNGIPSHHKDYKTSCVRGSRYQEKMYKDIIVDTAYTNMLIHIMEHPNDCYEFITAEEPECMLKEYYTEEGIGRSMIFYIKSTNSGISYASFAKGDPSPFTKEDKLKIKLGIDKVRKLKNIYHNF